MTVDGHPISLRQLFFLLLLQSWPLQWARRGLAPPSVFFGCLQPGRHAFLVRSSVDSYLASNLSRQRRQDAFDRCRSKSLRHLLMLLLFTSESYSIGFLRSTNDTQPLKRYKAFPCRRDFAVYLHRVSVRSVGFLGQFNLCRQCQGDQVGNRQQHSRQGAAYKQRSEVFATALYVDAPTAGHKQGPTLQRSIRHLGSRSSNSA